MFHGAIHFEPKVAVFNDGIEEILEIVIRFEVPDMASNEGCGVNCSSVDSSCDGPSMGSCVILIFFEKLFVHVFDH
jgi:hypothetical protein